MINLSRAMLGLYSQEFSEIGPRKRKEFLWLYDKTAAVNNLQAYALLAYYIYRKKARGPYDFSRVLDLFESQIEKIRPSVQFEDVAEAFSALDLFNKILPMKYWYARKDNPDLPYATFEPCPWYISVLEFCMRTRKLDFPLVQNWEEIFMELIKAIPAPKKRYESLYVSFENFYYAARNGDIIKWYQNKFCYGNTINFRRAYTEELRDMTQDSLSCELAKHGFGWYLVRAEIERREMVAASKKSGIK